MLLRKTEKYYIKRFKIYSYDKEKKGRVKVKRTTWWVFFVPILSWCEVVEQKDFPVRNW